MRIAIVNWTDRLAGGAETYVGQVAPALIGRGHEVLLWHEGHAPSDRGLIAGLDGLATTSAAHAGVDRALQDLRSWAPDVLFVQGLADPETERALIGHAPAVLFGHNYYGTCITGSKALTFPTTEPCPRRFGPACLLQFYPRRCGGLSPVTLVRDYRRQAARAALLGRYRAVVTFSEHMRREFINHGVAAGVVTTLPSIDAHPACAIVESSPPSRTVGHVRLAFVGRIEPLKGCRLLIETLRAVQAQLNLPVELNVAGDGPDMVGCRQAATKASAACADVRVEFHGWLDAVARHALLQQTDSLVVPSLWPEPFGLVGPEALAMGVPVAAFAVGGIPEWLEDGRTGALAPADPPTSAGLATAIVRTLTSDEIRTTVRRLGAQRRAVNTLDRHLERLMPVLTAAATGSGMS